MSIYYNEIDPFCVAWLRELMYSGIIPIGDIDDRSIEDVLPSDLEGYTQCHFFAGIGGWPYALRLAGWTEERPVWTGSCPCQPFSSAGERKGFGDERHLWPAFSWLIQQCRPSSVYGEQVAGKLGIAWVDAVSYDLETMLYAVAACLLPAASVGAPHIRERCYWVAHSIGFTDGGGSGRLHCGPRTAAATRERAGAINKSIDCRSVHGLEGFWSGCEWRACADGPRRPIKPSLEPVAYGIPKRVEQLRGYGNAIVPQVAAHFIAASM